MINLKNTLKLSFKALFMVVLCLVATEVAEAKTVTMTNSFVSQDAYIYFNNVYLRDEYSYGILATEYISNTSYNYTSYYYLCLTNDDVDISDSSSVSSSCDKLLKCNRESNLYTCDIVDDDNLTVKDTIYYYFHDDNYNVLAYLFIIALFVTICLFLVLFFIIFG